MGSTSVRLVSLGGQIATWLTFRWDHGRWSTPPHRMNGPRRVRTAVPGKVLRASPQHLPSSLQLPSRPLDPSVYIPPTSCKGLRIFVISCPLSHNPVASTLIRKLPFVSSRLGYPGPRSPNQVTTLPRNYPASLSLSPVVPSLPTTPPRSLGGLGAETHPNQKYFQDSDGNPRDGRWLAISNDRSSVLQRKVRRFGRI